MAKCSLSPAAAADIASILSWTQGNFGKAARSRYGALLKQATSDLATNPTRPGRLNCPEISPNVFTYHLWHSRDNVPVKSLRVDKPRHFFLCRTVGQDKIEVGRVLHDAMDIDRHIPRDYQEP